MRSERYGGRGGTLLAQVLQPADGYWANRYLPGDPQRRWLETDPNGLGVVYGAVPLVATALRGRDWITSGAQLRECGEQAAP